MTSTFSGFYISLRSMQTQQTALNTASHNVANAKTEGYTRQRAEMAATSPWPYPAVNSLGIVGQIGTGVEITKMERVRDQFLDIQLRNETNTLGEWTVKQDTLEQVEVVFQEPTDTGLSTLITQFWDSWQELSMNPESINSAVRTTLVETAASLADALRYTHQQLEDIAADTDSIIKIDVDGINSTANQIKDLNQQIKKAKIAGFEPNDLMDKRDLLLDQLAEVIDFKVTDNGDGTIDVNLYNGATDSYDSRLVDGIEGHTNILETDDGSGSLVIQWADYSSTEPAGQLPAAGDELQVNGGKLYGLFDVRDNLISEYTTMLDTFASNLITQVNAIHADGYDLDGASGGEFFNGSSAVDIVIDPDISGDVSKIAAALDPDDLSGDGSNALAISKLRSKEGVCGGTSFDDYYRNLVSGLGVDSNEAQRMTTNQQALVDQLESRKESISGVSSDEELAHMLEFQHIYEASARFMTTLDEMLDTLINGTAL